MVDQHHGHNTQISPTQTPLETPPPPPPSTQTLPVAYEDEKLSIILAGHRVHFPLPPYAPQAALAATLVRALNNKRHALLESPTGTGKSLACLSAVLSWYTAHNVQQQRGNQTTPSTGAAAATTATPPPPLYGPAASGNARTGGTETTSSQKKRVRIFYGSRTHSQLQQLTEELRRTRFRPRMTVLASRKLLCTSKHNTKSVTMTGKKCKELIGQGCKQFQLAHRVPSKVHQQGSNVLCSTRKRRVTTEAEKQLPPVVDIEALIDAGKASGGCPYYGARAMLDDAELVLCPYNYLIDPIVRKAMGIDLKNAVLIIDEAHNASSVARDAASHEMLVDDVSRAMRDMKRVIDADVNYWQHVATLQRVLGKMLQFFEREKSDMLAQLRARAPGMGGAAAVIPGAGHRRSSYPPPSSSSQIWPASDMKMVLNDIGISASTLPSLNEAYQEVAKSLVISQRDADVVEEMQLSITTMAMVEALLNVWNLALYEKESEDGVPRRCGIVGAGHYNLEKLNYDGRRQQPETNTCQPNLEHFRMALVRKDVQDAPAGMYGSSSEHSFHICFWCMHASVIMRPIAQSARSLVLMSGTLTPFEAASAEMGVVFDCKVAAQHVVDNSRVFVKAISCDTEQRLKLKLTAQNFPKFSYLDALGGILSRTCTSVPMGVIVFFPSYKSLSQAHARWRSTGQLSELKRMKEVCVEPKGGDVDHHKLMEKYRRANTHQYAENQKKKKIGSRRTGGLLLAVARAKCSEGIDFSDNLARAIVVLGIPYPSLGDARVKLKRQHNDTLHTRGQVSSINGRRWYELEAFNAVNQCIGRVIRHKFDYGAILLVDSRYEERNFTRHLPAWVRRALKTGVHGVDSEGCAAAAASSHSLSESLKKFFKEMAQAPVQGSMEARAAMVSVPLIATSVEQSSTKRKRKRTTSRTAGHKAATKPKKPKHGNEGVSRKIPAADVADDALMISTSSADDHHGGWMTKKGGKGGAIPHNASSRSVKTINMIQLTCHELEEEARSDSDFI